MFRFQTVPSQFSKPISKTSDGCMQVIMEALDGTPTYGFDIDSIYYLEAEKKWVVIEFLKCDHPRVRPSGSHPRRYWQKNWRKFASLWRLAAALGAELYLINYEDQAHAEAMQRDDREFHVIEVKDMSPIMSGGILREAVSTYGSREFMAWFAALNRRGLGKPLAVAA